jgi:site-specific DNA-methyltransferase (adenine-specific)
MPAKSPRRLHEWWLTPPRKLVQQYRSGDLVCGDALEFLAALRESCADIVFLDPPFNLGKAYGSSEGRADRMIETQYVDFITAVLSQSVRILRPGGSLFLYHVPRFAIRFAQVLGESLIFRHWIAVSMKNGFVRGAGLYPAHYALLHYSSGKPNVAKRPKIPPATCPHCGEYIRDYGGYKKHVEHGVNLSDVWDDLSPVRHTRYKRRAANELPLAIPKRAVAMTGLRKGVLVDPFAGTGTALVAARLAGMRYVGCDREPDNVALITDRINSLLRKSPRHVRL